MSEHHKHPKANAEHHIPVQEARQHEERLKVQHEKAAEKAARSTAEQHTVRAEVKEQAISGAEYHKPHSEQRQHTAPLTKKDKAHSFNSVMHHARQEMSRPERTFSKFIHQPGVEKASEVLGKTVARPSGIAGAAIASFIGLLSVYSVARFAGFQLSGSEMPLLLAIGFGAGLFIEWATKAARSIFSRVR